MRKFSTFFFRLNLSLRSTHIDIPSVSGRLNQDRIPPTARRLAWQDQSETSTSAIQCGVSRQRPSSNYLCPNNQASNMNITHYQENNLDDGETNQRISSQDPSLWIQPITPSCVPPSVSTTFEKLKKYLNVNIHSFLVISMLLPPTVLIFCINIWNLKFEDWGHFVDNLMFTQMIFYSLYPYVVKK